MSDELVSRLRASLPGIAQEECGGDNLAILLASFFEPGIESDELDDSGTWKQGAIDACDSVLDAIHAHYATALTEARAEIERLRGDLVNERRVVTTQSEARVAAESELSTLRARVREVVGGMLAHSCVADAGPDCKDEEDEAVERAARQLMEDLK